jgi:hypothetical protein
MKLPFLDKEISILAIYMYAIFSKGDIMRYLRHVQEKCASTHPIFWGFVGLQFYFLSKCDKVIYCKYVSLD